MKTVVTLLVIFLVQCANLRAEPMLTKENVGEMLGSDSCIFGVKSVSVFLHNSLSEGKNINKEDICPAIKNDLSKPIAFVVHGFVSSANASQFKELISHLKQKGYTVFAVDWSQGACTNGIPMIKFLNYPSAVENTIEIGQHIASYVKTIVYKCGVPLKNIIFIGHSLGAHVCGFAAKNISKSFEEKISLIIGADPANPLFGLKACENRLCQSDAGCLKVLQTSTLGINDLGHMNLKFDGGWMQPGCNINVGCSHTRSVDYLSDMLKNKTCGFVGVPTESKMSSVTLHKVKAMLPTTMLESFSSPPYPSPDTKNCIFINDNILDNRNCPKKDNKNFYMFVAKDSPHCTSETFSCEQ